MTAREHLAAALSILQDEVGQQGDVASNDRSEALRLIREAWLVLAPSTGKQNVGHVRPTPTIEMPTRIHGRRR
jgi:hypothetical protein